MPTYEYECRKCGYVFEQVQSIKDDSLTKCPKCKKKALERIIHSPMIFVRGEVKTLYQQAERNSKRFGRDYVAEQQEKEKAKAIQARKELAQKLPRGASLLDKTPETPWWRPGTSAPDKSLGKLTEKQARVYIREGKKNG